MKNTCTRAAAAVCGLAVALTPVACGSDRQFDAESLVADLNGAGAGLELGEPLVSTEEETEVRVVRFASAEGDVAPRPGSDDHGAGAVVMLENETEAEAEFQRCENAPSFICFRVGNGVLRFTEISPAEQAQITASARALAAE